MPLLRKLPSGKIVPAAHLWTRQCWFRFSISQGLRLYYAQQTPEQRKTRASHLHTPAMKAKAQQRANAAKWTPSYREKQRQRRYNYLAHRYAATHYPEGGE